MSWTWARGPARWLALGVGRLAGGDVVTTVRTAARLVALTVDDGPHPVTTPALLDVLAAHRVRATFFVLGERARAHPGLLARIAAEGHELGNHLERDEPSVLLRGAEFDRQLAAVHALLAPHGPVRFFRPGSGWFTPRMLRSGARSGYRCALGTPGLAVAAYGGPGGPGALGARLAGRCRPGDVVVLHEGTAARAAVPGVAVALVTALARRGLTATTLSALTSADRDRPNP